MAKKKKKNNVDVQSDIVLPKNYISCLNEKICFLARDLTMPQQH